MRLCRDEIQGRPVGEAIRQEEATKINTSEIVKRRSVGGTVTPRVSVSYSETKIPSISALARCRCARNQLFETPQCVDVKLCRLATENVHISDMTLTT